jgi:hypothetical protein
LHIFRHDVFYAQPAFDFLDSVHVSLLYAR